MNGFNTTDKRCLKEQKELLGKIAINSISNIGIIPSASKDASIKFVEQFLHMINNKERLNGLKFIIKTQEIESLFNFNNIYKIFIGTMKLITEL